MPRSDEERERELLSERGNKVSRKPAAEWEQVYEGTEADRDSSAAGKDKKTSKNGHQSVVKSHDIVYIICALLQVLPLPLPVLRWYQNLVDCGLYWSDQCGVSGELSDATVTLLVDKQLVELLKGGEREKSEQQAEIVKTLEHGEERGLEVDNVLTFYSKWQKQSQKK